MIIDGTGTSRRTAARAGPGLLCAELVGRDAEITDLTARLDALPDGTGGLITLVGEAGAGKTRLATALSDAALAAGMPVLSGRAVPSTSPVPYRPLTEAFLAAFRGTPMPQGPDLVGFGGYLRRLVPAWQSDSMGGAEESPVLLGEAVVRLLRLLGEGQGCVLLLEDLHWADPETLAVVDYLGDALSDEAVLCVCTSRPDGAAMTMLDRLTRRDHRATVPVAPLDDTEIERMVTVCTGMPDPPADLVAFLQGNCDGLPFLVEELLAGVVAAGELRFDDGRWVSSGELTPALPSSLRESVRQRLVRLDHHARRVIGAAALLGRRFDWDLLPGITELDGPSVIEGLRAAVDDQLIEPDGDGFVFRHALTREAVLGDLLSPDRRQLAARALAAIERAYPGLPESLCELAADLAETAGENAVAAQYLVESATRAFSNDALTSAEITARRAQRLAANDADRRLAADEALVRILAAAGKPGEALTLGTDVVSRMSETDPVARADLLLTIARAALVAGNFAAAADHAEQARAALPTPADAAVVARIDAVAAHVALEQVRLDDATALAEAAVAAAAATDQPAVECEALVVLGRVTRADDATAAGPWFQRAAAVAAAAGLVDWELRAQQELAIISWPAGDLEPLRTTRELAVRHGALVTVAVMDLTLADIALSDFDTTACLRAAQACAEASTKYGLATESVAHLWLAGAHALTGNDDAMSAAIDDALRRDPTDPRILGDLYGRVLTTRSIVADDIDALPGQLETMMEHVRVAPTTTSVFPGQILWATLHTLDDDDLGEAARAEFAVAARRTGLERLAVAAQSIDAIALARAGEVETATASLRTAYHQLRGIKVGGGMLHVQQLLIARAAIQGEWGEPVAWLREAEAFFAAHGHDRPARRCRIMLSEAGAPVPRRGRGESEVPASLRALGVTSREVDVLKLAAAGHSNREIGERLFLSTKTVERHLSSLFARTGAANRRALGGLARDHGLAS